MFSFVKNCWSVFQSGCTMLYSHQHASEFLLLPHPRQHLLLSVSWFWVILIDLWWYLILVCISLMTYKMEHFFICLFAICVLWWGVCSDLLHILKSGYLFSYCWVLRVLCVSWLTVLYQTSFTGIFFPSVACLFTLVASSSFSCGSTVKTICFSLLIFNVKAASVFFLII